MGAGLCGRAVLVFRGESRMTSLYTAGVSRLVFPLQERVKGHTTSSVRRGLEETQWWTRERLQSLQLYRLRRLVEQSAQHVPYYRARGLDPARIRELDDLRDLPFLTKADI